MAIPPLTILEAYACARPVILTSCIPGFKELIPRGFEGLVAPRPIAEELLEALRNALNLSAKESYELRSFCVNKHSIDVVTRKLLTVYEKLWHCDL